MNKRNFLFIIIVLGLFVINGCASTMSKQEVFSLEKIEAEAKKDDNKFEPFEAMLVPMSLALYYAEDVGFVHDIYFKNEKSGNKPKGDKKSGFLVFRKDKQGNDRPFTLLTDTEGFDFNRRFFNGTRVKDGQVRQHGPEMGEKTVFCGPGSYRFNWKYFGKPSDYPDVEVFRVNSPDDPRNIEIEKDFERMFKLGKRLFIPSKMEEIVKSFGIINLYDLALLTDFEKLYLVFGVKLWPAIMKTVGVEDLNSLWYDTRTIKAHEFGKRVAEIHRRIDGISGDSSDVGVATYQKDRFDWLEIMTSSLKKYCEDYGEFCEKYFEYKEEKENLRSKIGGAIKLP